MVTTAARRIFIENISDFLPGEVRLRGWVYRLRILGKTAFVILRGCSGEAQCVIASEALKDHKLKVEDVVEILGSVRAEPRSKTGCEVDIHEIRVLNRAGQNLPFQSGAQVDSVGLETLIQYRPLSLRSEAVGDIFRMQAAILASFRDALNRRRFTEIVTSKIVSGGTEGGSNLSKSNTLTAWRIWHRVHSFIRNIALPAWSASMRQLTYIARSRTLPAAT
jgi:nondiscriminating aspartyl-tRNA synthetase